MKKWHFYALGYLVTLTLLLVGRGLFFVLGFGSFSFSMVGSHLIGALFLTPLVCVALFKLNRYFLRRTR